VGALGRAGARRLQASFEREEPRLPYEPPPPSCSVRELRGDGEARGDAGRAGGSNEPRLLLFTLVDPYSEHTRLGVAHDGRAWVFGEPVSDVLHWNACNHGGSGGLVHAARIEPGTPLVATFETYAWTRTPSIAWVELPDGGVLDGEGESTRELTQRRCTIGPAAPSCTVTSLAKKHGTAREPGLERMPPLPW
jgi:hypothetical protein